MEKSEKNTPHIQIVHNSAIMAEDRINLPFLSKSPPSLERRIGYITAMDVADSAIVARRAVYGSKPRKKVVKISTAPNRYIIAENPMIKVVLSSSRIRSKSISRPATYSNVKRPIFAKTSMIPGASKETV